MWGISAALSSQVLHVNLPERRLASSLLHCFHASNRRVILAMRKHEKRALKRCCIADRRPVPSASSKVSKGREEAVTGAAVVLLCPKRPSGKTMQTSLPCGPCRRHMCNDLLAMPSGTRGWGPEPSTSDGGCHPAHKRCNPAYLRTTGRTTVLQRV